MLRVQAGDIGAYEEIVQRYKDLVFGMAHSMLRSWEDAEEAAQDTFLKLFRYRNQYDAGRPLEPWLLRIAGNTCRDLLRRRRSGRLPTVTGIQGGVATELLADIGPSQERAQDSRDQAVRTEISRLSDKMRQPLVLKYLNAFTNQQIADALDISVSNVKVRVARAKDILQGRLERVLEG
jgi:RNA polymerase sigma-70 factor (ECF subfamily)